MIPTGMSRIEALRASSSAALVVDVTGLPLDQQVVVGVVDSGIDSGHPDLNYAGGQTFTAASDSQPGDSAEPGVDHYGHGTHVAGEQQSVFDDWMLGHGRW
jgi:subtilisin family serine protease